MILKIYKREKEGANWFENSVLKLWEKWEWKQNAGVCSLQKISSSSSFFCWMLGENLLVWFCF